MLYSYVTFSSPYVPSGTPYGVPVLNNTPVNLSYSHTSTFRHRVKNRGPSASAALRVLTCRGTRETVT